MNFTLHLTRDEVVALSRAMQDKIERIMKSPSGSMDDLYTIAHLSKVIEKLPEPEELDPTTKYDEEEEAWEDRFDGHPPTMQQARKMYEI